MKSDSESALLAAQAYEQLHVPALFRQWAPRLLEAVKVEPGHRLLDVACGTGVVAREALARVGPGGSVSGLDAGPGMIALARSLAPSVDWKEGEAESLPYADSSFDIVLCQFGLMFFRDRIRSLQEMARVLVPAGRVGVAVWASLDESEAYPEAVDLLQKIAGSAAADALRAPFVLGDSEKLQGLFEQAGLADFRIRTTVGRAHFPALRTMMEADLRGWLPVMGVYLSEETIEQILREAENVLACYVQEDGSVAFEAPAHIVTARKPTAGA